MIINTLSDAKEYILHSIKPKISYKRNAAVTPNLRKEIFEIIEKFNPALIQNFNNHTGKYITIKKHLLYCFLNDLNITKFTGYFNINNELNRIVNRKSLSEFAYSYGTASGSEYFYNKGICDAGLDLLYPRLQNYNREKISKIIQRIKAKHKNQTVCNIKCQSFLTSERMKIFNPSTIYEISQESRVKQSNTLKRKIQNGEWTPCVTNSWANSKVYIKLFNKNFRSTWEAYFYIYNKSIGIDIEYEKIRIPYFDSIRGTDRNYIVDFVDYDNKIIYEIKPEGLKDNQNVIDKENAADKWCGENGYTFKFVSDEWLKLNYNELLLKDIEETYKVKIIKGLSQFL